MRIKNRFSHITVLFNIFLLCFLFGPKICGSSSENEQTQVVFVVNDPIDLGSSQTREYQFPLWLYWVGSHARVRIQGGVINGHIPNSLIIKVIIDGIESQQTFTRMNGLQKHYTFHSTSEYVLTVPPPVRPTLDGIKTLHNFTVELTFIFDSIPEGTGILHEIIFETFTPSTLDLSEARSLTLLQNQFSWKIGLWSFSTYFFNTSLIIPLLSSQNIYLEVTMEFSGLPLDGWQLIIQQEARELNIHDSPRLEGALVIDPTLPCELRLIVNPPQVSEPEVVYANIEVQGVILPLQEPSSPNTNTLDPVSEKRLVEGLMLVQLGIVIMPILAYYRIRHPTLRNSRKEEEK
ncbi:MAG: hypothetical protein ACFFBD_10655 [Candidatus Hodarchaeota archaeon]